MKPKTAAKSDSTHPKRQNESTRERVLEAAFTLFCEHGFSDVCMLEIATRAQGSKRDLYALFRNKQAVLAHCIKERAQRLRGPLDEADQAPKNREALAASSELKTAGPLYCDPSRELSFWRPTQSIRLLWV